MRCLQLFMIGAALGLATAARAELAVGKKAPEVVLEGKDGGRLDGSRWDSSEIKNKVYVLFYVAPSERHLNDHVSETLKKAGLAHDRFGSIAVINCAATSLPNFLLTSMLKSTQKEYPNTLYVKDLDRKLVKTWKLADDSSDVVAFDRDGTVLFSRDGKLSNADVDALLAALKAHI